jgi:hypothetical protein
VGGLHECGVVDACAVVAQGGWHGAIKLKVLRTEMLGHVKHNFRAIRAEAPEVLATLREDPDRMLEVMNVI